MKNPASLLKAIEPKHFLSNVTPPIFSSWQKCISALSVFFLILSFLLFLLPNALYSYSALFLVYLLVGTPALSQSIEQLSKWQVDLDLLMTLAAFSSIWISHGFEGGLLLTLFYLSKTIETDTTNAARAHLNSLHNLAPQKATARTSSSSPWIEMAVEKISPGNQVRIASGQIIPCDGKVLEGKSEIVLKHLTGESLPQMAKRGTQVYAGSENLLGTLIIEVTSTAKENTIAKIIRLIEQAQEKKPYLQRWFDRFSGLYAKGVIFFSTTFAVTLPLFSSIPFWGQYGSVYRALSFLIAASPCALIIALPVTYVAALSACARRGILIKGTHLFETLASVQTIAFDKTGTLTQSTLQVTQLLTLSNKKKIQQEEIDLHLSALLMMQQRTKHPIASSLQEYLENEFSLQEATQSLQMVNFETLPGKGLTATFQLHQCTKNTQSSSLQEIDRFTCIAGDPHWVSNFTDLQPAIIESIADQRSSPARLLLFSSPLAITLITLKDLKRPEAPQVIADLKALSIEPCMLTGDRASAAHPVAKELGIDTLHTQLSPQEKLDHIETLSNESVCAMVGDGINDAPSLARAHIGIAMAKLGSGAATYAADILLFQDRLEDLPWLITLGRKTRKIALQNLCFAAGALVIASIAALLGKIPMWAAVISHEGGTVLVALNGLRMLSNPFYGRNNSG